MNTNGPKYDVTIRDNDLVMMAYHRDGKIYRITNMSQAAPNPNYPGYIPNPTGDLDEVFDLDPLRNLKKKRKTKPKSFKKWDIAWLIKVDSNSIDTLKAKLDELTLLLP